MRMTQNRKLVLDIIKSSSNPLNAEMIYSMLPVSTMNLSTVYRILDFFTLEDIIDKMTIDTTAFYYLKTDYHHHYFICNKCGKMIPIDCNLIDNNNLKQQGFLIEHHDLTVYGLCPVCQTKQ